MYNYKRVLILSVIVCSLSACAASTGFRQFYTRGSNAFHDIKLEVTPELQKIANVENLTIDRKQGAGQSFMVSGDIQHDRTCRVLSVDVSFINTAGVVLKNTQAPIMNYKANTKARFQASAYIVVMIGETKDIIDKVVLDSLKCFGAT
jgi:hypothetical protein